MGTKQSPFVCTNGELGGIDVCSYNEGFKVLLKAPVERTCVTRSVLKMDLGTKFDFFEVTGVSYMTLGWMI